MLPSTRPPVHPSTRPPGPGGRHAPFPRGRQRRPESGPDDALQSAAPQRISEPRPSGTAPRRLAGYGITEIPARPPLPPGPYAPAAASPGTSFSPRITPVRWGGGARPRPEVTRGVAERRAPTPPPPPGSD
jgi:hypothetical protein